MSKYPTSSAARSEDARDAGVSAALSQVHRDDTEIIEEEGIDSRQRGHKSSLENLLRQCLRIQRALADRITKIEADTEMSNAATRTRSLDDSVLKEVQTSTKN